MSAVVAARTDDGIRLEGLAKTFRGPDGPIYAVRGIDVSIAAGETAALLGPNGAGKSTTIDMLLGLAKPDRGTTHARFPRVAGRTRVAHDARGVWEAGGRRRRALCAVHGTSRRRRR